MVGAIGIPDPVIGIKRMTLICMNFAVGGTEIFSIFTDIHRPFLRAVKGSIEYGFIVSSGSITSIFPNVSFHIFLPAAATANTS